MNQGFHTAVQELILEHLPEVLGLALKRVDAHTTHIHFEYRGITYWIDHPRQYDDERPYRIPLCYFQTNRESEVAIEYFDAGNPQFPELIFERIQELLGRHN